MKTRFGQHTYTLSVTCFLYVNSYKYGNDAKLGVYIPDI